MNADFFDGSRLMRCNDAPDCTLHICFKCWKGTNAYSNIPLLLRRQKPYSSLITSRSGIRKWLALIGEAGNTSNWRGRFLCPSRRLPEVFTEKILLRTFLGVHRIHLLILYRTSFKSRKSWLVCCLIKGFNPWRRIKSVILNFCLRPLNFVGSFRYEL